MTAATGERCAATTNRRNQCARTGTTVVAGVEEHLCKQHARIVATEPGASGIVRILPVGLAAIITELDQARTTADIDRCRHAITDQIAVCSDPANGLKPALVTALRSAKERVRNNGGR